MPRSRFVRALPLFLFSVSVFALIAADASAREAIIETKSGLRYEGEVIRETDETVVIRDRNDIATPIPRDAIASMELKKPVEEELADRLEALEPDDADGHYAAMSWLVFEEEAYGLAKRTLNDLVEQFPDDNRFKALLRIAIERDKLARESRERAERRKQEAARDREDLSDDQPEEPDGAEGAAAGPSPSGDAEEAGKPDSPRRPARSPREMMDERLDEDAINLIRVYEIDLNERPTVSFPRDMWDDVFAEYGSDDDMPRTREGRNRVRSARGWEQLRLLFQLRARDYYGKARVRRDPPFMRTFATTIHRQYVLNYCGTNKCHGGEDAGSFFLFNRRPTDPRTVYSNYLILHGYTGTQANMLEPDPQLSERALLVQHGLKQVDAQYPHPQVEGWRPYSRFAERGTNSPLYREIRDWMEQMVVKPSEGYPIDWTVPTITAADDSSASGGDDESPRGEADAQTQAR